MFENDNGEPTIMEVSGGTALISFGALSQAFFGKTTIRLQKRRLIEDKRTPLTRRYSKILLSEIDSIEMVIAPSALLLLLGLLTIGIGVGLVFLLIYLFYRRRYFLVRSKSNVHVLMIQGGITQYEEFMEEVLRAAEAEKIKIAPSTGDNAPALGFATR